MKIKTIRVEVFGLSLIVPIDGRIDIDKDGIADVSEECAKVLTTATNDWDYVVSESDEEIEETDEEDEEDRVEGTVDKTDAETADVEELGDNLKDMTLEQLRETARELNLPEDEWKKILNKSKLSEYIIEKYKEIG